MVAGCPGRQSLCSFALGWYVPGRWPGRRRSRVSGLAAGKMTHGLHARAARLLARYGRGSSLTWKPISGPWGRRGRDTPGDGGVKITDWSVGWTAPKREGSSREEAQEAQSGNAATEATTAEHAEHAEREPARFGIPRFPRIPRFILPVRNVRSLRANWTIAKLGLLLLLCLLAAIWIMSYPPNSCVYPRMASIRRFDSRGAKAQNLELVAGAPWVLLRQQFNSHLVLAQMALMVPSWLKPCGVAGLRVLAQYHHWLPIGACRVRLPGISSQPLGSCSRNHFHA